MIVELHLWRRFLQRLPPDWGTDLQRNEGETPSLKLTASLHLKMDVVGILSRFLYRFHPIFSGMAVSFREGIRFHAEEVTNIHSQIPKQMAVTNLPGCSHLPIFAGLPFRPRQAIPAPPLAAPRRRRSLEAEASAPEVVPGNSKRARREVGFLRMAQGETSTFLGWNFFGWRFFGRKLEFFQCFSKKIGETSEKFYDFWRTKRHGDLIGSWNQDFLTHSDQILGLKTHSFCQERLGPPKQSRIALQLHHFSGGKC